MGILLKDDEIRAELEKIPPQRILFYQSSYEESSIEWNEFIARAQLKKVVEWLEKVSSTQTCDTAPDNCWKTYRVMTIDIWQALKKEAGG